MLNKRVLDACEGIAFLWLKWWIPFQSGRGLISLIQKRHEHGLTKSLKP